MSKGKLGRPNRPPRPLPRTGHFPELRSAVLRRNSQALPQRQALLTQLVNLFIEPTRSVTNPAQPTSNPQQNPPANIPVSSLVNPEETAEDLPAHLRGHRLKTYYPEKKGDYLGVGYTMVQPDHETLEIHSRPTRDGRTIFYELKVAQQPARARACGSGPRSSADRRPVDPPPVVQFRVFDNDPRKPGARDITLGYDATFILYASLEVARPIAHGRIFSGPVTPVLTGVPVAGIAYLEKPEKAGYFIFPDLSVRHEGWYNLKFDLFEAAKNPADAHPETPIKTDSNGNPRTPFTHDGQTVNPNEKLVNVTYVRSEKFQVYSAKKFPGLNSSTEMSRIIADQGCRVRIRREVRMRKKTGKGDVELDLDARSSRAPSENHSRITTPIQQHSRPGSRNSYESNGQYHVDQDRRRSLGMEYSPLPSMSSLPPLMAPVSRTPTNPSYPYQGQSQMHSPSIPPGHSARPSFSLPTLPPLSRSSMDHPPPPQRLSIDSTSRRESSSRMSVTSLINAEPSPMLPPPNGISSSPIGMSLPPLAPPHIASPRAVLPPLNQNGGPSNYSYGAVSQLAAGQKRTHSSSTYSMTDPLKDRARPDEQKVSQPGQYASQMIPWSRNGANGLRHSPVMAIEAGDDDAEDESDSEGFSASRLVYKRADGSTGQRSVRH